MNFEVGALIFGIVILVIMGIIIGITIDYASTLTEPIFIQDLNNVVTGIILSVIAGLFGVFFVVVSTKMK